MAPTDTHEGRAKRGRPLVTVSLPVTTLELLDALRDQDSAKALTRTDILVDAIAMLARKRGL